MTMPSHEKWQELRLRIDACDVSRAEALLRLAGAEAVSLHDATGVPVFEPAPGETPLWSAVFVHALFPCGLDLAALSRVLAEALQPTSTIDVRDVNESQWQQAGAAKFAPRLLGDRLCLLPADLRDRDEPACNGRRCVRLHMGLAFGTGEHPTTRLCLESLDARVEPGAQVLDYGCGSGVLALAALALGARRAWAVDNDPQALVATARNARLNDVDHALWIGAPAELPEPAEISADLIVANILARPLEQLAPTFRRYLASRGRIVLSGILEEQCAPVLMAYAPYFENFVSAQSEGWIRIEADRIA